MENELQLFQNPDFGGVRGLMIDGEPWLVGKDVALVLGYSNASKAVMVHIDEEDKQFVMLSTSDSQNGNLVKTALINESGLYSLIFSSKLPNAKKFKHWVTSEVLPAIRKTGQYKREEAGRGVTVDDYLKAASIVATCRNERLRYVLGFLKQAGIEHNVKENEECQNPGFETEQAAKAAAVERMRQVKVDKDFSYTQLGRILGIDKVQIHRYVNGQVFPSFPRALFIIERLKEVQ